MANGDRTYALAARFPAVELPQKIEFSVDKQGFVRSYTFRGKVNEEGFTPAHEILRENINKLEAEANAKANTTAANTTPPEKPTMEPQGKPLEGSGNPTREPEKEVPEKQDTARPTLSPPPGSTLTIGGTVNLGNFEYLKLEVSGPAEEREGLIEYWKESLLLMGTKDEFTRSRIEGYVRRVFA